ncbi:tetraacyldisaccharide 4'-kinase [Terrimonas sp.]|uniref:tetraacyldisaccharide 4'-kinase n=1 Tax=Terrimonas sp. TaxID=1914338 RepID=UPI001F0C75A2|nr:tetraacyldisaccharide 4'-kinase [Terrimonas sp.]
MKIVRMMLFPFALFYGLAVKARNWLYNKNIIKSSRFNFPLIAVGNLSVGGTGKSPMVEYLIRLLLPEYNIATLSRGYKRKTRGYVLADERTTAIDIGDEPMQFHNKFPGVMVAVCEERAFAVPQILYDKPGTDVIILDDAFQHRQVDAGLNILLTDYNNPFYKDFFLPTGNLRDAKSSYKRADIIVVTKCPQDISSEEKDIVADKIKALPEQHLFFTGIKYGAPYHLVTKEGVVLNEQTDVLLVCGIANPKPLKAFIKERVNELSVLHYRDHYIFTIDDLRHIKKQFDAIASSQKIIIVTEKDAVRLIKFQAELKDMPVYVLPIEPYFLFNGSGEFNYLVKKFIKDFKVKS